MSSRCAWATDSLLLTFHFSIWVSCYLCCLHTDSALWAFPFPVLGRLTRETESDLGHCLPLYIPTLCGTQGYWEPVQVLGLGSDLQFLPRINLQTMGISDPYPDQEKAQDEICTDCEMFSKVVDWSSSLQDTFGCGSKPWGLGKLQNR